ncbi:hypothetical protein Tco_1393752 [Tanacetum coccineum]
MTEEGTVLLGIQNSSFGKFLTTTPLFLQQLQYLSSDALRTLAALGIDQNIVNRDNHEYVQIRFATPWVPNQFETPLVESGGRNDEKTDPKVLRENTSGGKPTSKSLADGQTLLAVIAPRWNKDLMIVFTLGNIRVSTSQSQFFLISPLRAVEFISFISLLNACPMVWLMEAACQ